MVAAMQARTGKVAWKQKAGRTLLAIGGAALFLQLWALWLEAGTTWSQEAAEPLGWIGALGITALQMVDFIAWNPHGILLSLVDRKSTRLNSSHGYISYAVFCLKKKK